MSSKFIKMLNKFAKIFKILYCWGLAIFLISFVLLILDIISPYLVLLLFIISVLLMEPDSLIFTIREAKYGHGNAWFWWGKFIGLQVALIGLVVGVFIIMFRAGN